MTINDKTPEKALAVRIDGLTYSYDKRSPENDIAIPKWQLEQGEQVFLQGKSGSGKTTLLNLLAGVLTPSEGTIELFGTPFSRLSARKRDKFRANNIGVVFQQFNLIPYLSVWENIALSAYFSSTSQAHLKDSALSLIEQLKLPADVINSPASELSVGQQQRIAIARALINTPGLLLVDEPTSALDASARDAFMEVLLLLCQERSTTLIFVSHDMALKPFFTNHTEIAQLKESGEEASCC